MEEQQQPQQVVTVFAWNDQDLLVQHIVGRSATDPAVIESTRVDLQRRLGVEDAVYWQSVEGFLRVRVLDIAVKAKPRGKRKAAKKNAPQQIDEGDKS